MIKLSPLALVIVVLVSCSYHSSTEKYYDRNLNVVDVSGKVMTVDILLFVNRFACPHIFSDYLMIADGHTIEEGIHVFDKNTFVYISSFGKKGRGPGEITSMGNLAFNEIRQLLYITDHGRNNILEYDLEEVIGDPMLVPRVKRELEKTQKPMYYEVVNDSIAVGIILEPVGNNDFRQTVGTWNMNTGEINVMPYTHPDIKKKRIELAVSVKNNIYVESYDHHDLLTICTLDGELICNIYGKNYDTKVSNKKFHYNSVVICGDKIVTSYAGTDNFDDTKAKFPTKFIVFDLDGNYIKTLETGVHIIYYKYDVDNNRMVMALDEETQLAYLDLDGLLDA